jgi:hypothetical protein
MFLVQFTKKGCLWAEVIFDGLREAQGLRRTGVLNCTSKRRGLQRDKARREKRFSPYVV